jgi:hypothetical protein
MVGSPPPPVITAAQVGANHALLGWTARSLAKRAIVPVHSLERIEGDGKITGIDPANLDAVQRYVAPATGEMT